MNTQEVFVSEHISATLIERYRQRQIEPPELLALDEHLSNCAQCRQQLRSALAVDAAALRLKTNLTTLHETADHLPQSQLRLYLAETLDAVDRELAESHLEFCATCQNQLEQLRLAKQPEQSPGQTDSPKKFADWFRNHFFALPMAIRFAGAIVLLALLIWAAVSAFRQLQPQPEMKPEVAQNDPSPNPTNEPFKPAVQLALNDGGKVVTIGVDGTLSGFESLDAAEQQAIKDALLAGRIEIPASLSELKSGAGSLMGGPDDNPAKQWAASSKKTLASPFAEIIAEDKPTFRWQPLAGAQSYVVTINEPAANYREVVASPKLQTTRWTAPALPRGRLFTWQVTATLKEADRTEREVTAPAAEAAEAKFRVLTKSEAEELAKGKTDYAGQHLPLGLLYARLGLLKNAETELQDLAADNPDAPAVQKLLKEIRAARQATNATR